MRTGSKAKARNKREFSDAIKGTAPDRSLEWLQAHEKGPRINPIYENGKNYVEYLSLRL